MVSSVASATKGMVISLLAFASFAVMVATQGQVSSAGEQQSAERPGRVVQEMKIEAPAMTEEDQYGYVMPEKYKCQSCRAVMFHLDEALRKAHISGKRLKSWEYNELFDETCKSAFTGYGIRLVNGQNALGGPAFRKEEAKLEAGSGSIQMSGESWTKRLGEICRRVVYEKIGEDELYDRFYKGLQVERGSKTKQTADGEVEPILSESICRTELKECGALGPQPPTVEKSQKKEDKKNSKSKEKAIKKPIEAKKGKNEKGVADKSESKHRAVSAGSKLGLEEFARALAVKHGYSSDEYVGTRTELEWEKLFLSIGSRIFNRMAESDGTCIA